MNHIGVSDIHIHSLHGHATLTQGQVNWRNRDHDDDEIAAQKFHTHSGIKDKDI